MPTLTLLLAALALAAGLLIGRAIGERRGRAAQWVDDYLASAAKDRARRNRLGQFKETR